MIPDWDLFQELIDEFPIEKDHFYHLQNESVKEPPKCWPQAYLKISKNLKELKGSWLAEPV